MGDAPGSGPPFLGHSQSGLAGGGGANTGSATPAGMDPEAALPAWYPVGKLWHCGPLGHLEGDRQRDLLALTQKSRGPLPVRRREEIQGGWGGRRWCLGSRQEATGAEGAGTLPASAGCSLHPHPRSGWPSSGGLVRGSAPLYAVGTQRRQAARPRNNLG